MSNLIIFIQSFSCMFVGFNVRIECVKLVKNRTTCDLLANGSWVDNSQLACDWLWVDNSRKVTWEAHAESWRVKCQEASCDLTNSQDDLRDALLACFSVLFSFLYPYYKSSHYPWNCKETFREKTLEIHLKVRDCKPIIIYTFLLVFLYSYLSNYIPLSRGVHQTA